MLEIACHEEEEDDAYLSKSSVERAEIVGRVRINFESIVPWSHIRWRQEGSEMKRNEEK